MAEGHRDRLKKRFQAEGLSHFEPHTALELLLFYVIPRRDTNPIAHELIRRFGSFSGVLDAPLEELMKVDGIGESAALFLKMIPQAASFYGVDRTKIRKQLSSVDEVGAYLVPRFIGRTTEEVYMLCLDSNGRILHGDFISKGTVTSTSLPLRTIVECALRVSASRVILAHNHPNGFALPSSQDVIATHQVYRSLDTLGIRLDDHIIVSGDDFISMAQSGSLKPF